MATFADRSKKYVSRGDSRDDEIIKSVDEITDYENNQVDEEKLANLLKRTNVYGDLIQGETEESLRILLQKTQNDIPKLIEYVTAKHRHTQVFQPPTVYQDNDVAYKPPVLHIEKEGHSHQWTIVWWNLIEHFQEAYVDEINFLGPTCISNFDRIIYFILLYHFSSILF